MGKFSGNLGFVEGSLQSRNMPMVTRLINVKSNRDIYAKRGKLITIFMMMSKVKLYSHFHCQHLCRHALLELTLQQNPVDANNVRIIILFSILYN